MPVVTIPRIVRPEHAVEHIASLISDSTLNIAYVAKYDEALLPEYPAVQVLSAPFQKELHGVGTWLLTPRADIYVLHAVLTEDRRTRNLRDLELATQIVALLENDITLGGRVIASWVESEVPGAKPPRTAKGEAVISTLLSWRGTQEGRF